MKNEFSSRALQLGRFHLEKMRKVTKTKKKYYLQKSNIKSGVEQYFIHGHRMSNACVHTQIIVSKHKFKRFH